MDVCLTWSDNIDEWTKRVRRDGKWFEPNWWLDECYIVRSPYSRQEIEAAFQQLQNVFSPQVFLKLLGTGKLDTPKGMLATLESINPIPLGLATRHQTMAADSPNIFGLDVGDPITLGLDLDTTWQRSKPLIRRLRTHKGYFGARWELSVMAALTRQKIIFEYEPLRGAFGMHNPDFLIPPNGNGIFWECKTAEISAYMIDDWQLLGRLNEGISGRLQPWPESLVKVEPTPELNAELMIPSGRSRFKANLDKICEKIRELIQITVATGNLPSTHTVEGIRCIISSSSSRIIEVTGFKPDQAQEADRIMKNAIIKADEQIPEGRLGVALVALSIPTAPHSVADHIINCFKEIQHETLRLIGVVLSFDSLQLPVERIIWPIENSNLQTKIQSFVLDALYKGLNYHRRRFTALL